jgi:hypothetical protein
MKLRLVVMCLGLAYANSCATTEEKQKPPGRTHYTLQPAAKVPGVWPMGSQTPIQVRWHLSDGQMELEPGFRGWDFDGDNRFDLLEVLKSDGSVQMRAYDLDGDGVVDVTE